ncbi:MAG TPA: hypothetical protein VGC21_05155 [Telluria sp.]|jgi:hypothetical protein
MGTEKPFEHGSEETKHAPEHIDTQWQEAKRNESLRRKWQRYKAKRDDYGWDYFMLVKAERRGVDPKHIALLAAEFKAFDDNVATLEKRFESQHDTPTLQEVWGLDLALTQILPLPALRAKSQSVWESNLKLSRDKPVESFAEFMDRNDDETLRAEVTDMMRGGYWYQLNAILLERGFRSLKKILLRWASFGFVFTTFVIIVLHLVGTYSLLKPELTHALCTIFLTAYMGVLGAVISISRRTRAFNDIAASDADPVVRLMAIKTGITGIQLSIVAGGVFAIVLYLVFVSKIAGSIFIGDIMPKFGHEQVTDPNSQVWLRGLAPTLSIDLAKLLLWSFIAGFAEKLVPDVLDRFAKISSRESGSSNPSH